VCPHFLSEDLFLATTLSRKEYKIASASLRLCVSIYFSLRRKDATNTPASSQNFCSLPFYLRVSAFLSEDLFLATTLSRKEFPSPLRKMFPLLHYLFASPRLCVITSLATALSLKEYKIASAPLRLCVNISAPLREHLCAFA
jgi:hypothetical protein